MQNGYLQPSDFGDDDITSILGLGQNNSQQERLQLQMKLANQLRQEQPAQGQSVPQGSTFIPPSPLTTAMQTFDHLQGIVATAQGKKDGAKLDADRQTGLERFAKLWFNQNKGGNADPTADPNNAAPPSLTGTGGYGQPDQNIDGSSSQ
jgi:hypothetical protein